MRARDLARETSSALFANLGRTLLTVLGIVIGISAVIAMTSFIGGISQSMMGSLGFDAARQVYIYPYNDLSDSDLETLQQTVGGYEFISVSTFASGTATTADGTVQASVTGGDENFFTVSGLTVKYGRTWTPEEEENSSTVCVLTPNTVRQLFGDAEADPTGQTVTINNIPYQIIGVVESGREGMGQDGYGEFYMPMSTVKARLQSDGWYSNNYVGFAYEDEDVDDLMERTKSEIARMQGIDEDEADDYIYLYSMKSVIDELEQFTTAFSLIIGAVAGISLVVGGIGIMNMMLTNVTERIHEIGLRRALGATRNDITTQFLCESIAISVVGGIIGILVGYAGSWVISIVVSSMGILDSAGMTSGGITPVVSPTAVATATGICILIGLVFGYGPARRAAKLDPAEALRYQ